MNQNKENFEQFFEAQPFHQTLRFTEGNRLFICDVIDGVTNYRNLTVQACWATWQHMDSKTASATQELDRLADHHWLQWDIHADGYDQGKASAYEHAAQLMQEKP